MRRHIWTSFIRSDASESGGGEDKFEDMRTSLTIVRCGF